jgi:hypothetical protein
MTSETFSEEPVSRGKLPMGRWILGMKPNDGGCVVVVLVMVVVVVVVMKFVREAEG